MSGNVLIVESHNDLRQVIAEVLTRADYRCDAVAGPADALLKLRSTDYSLILVDVDSPSKLEPFLEAVESDPALRSRLVMITEESVVVSDARHLQKPFDTRALLRAAER